jgi:hypothetical protein
LGKLHDYDKIDQVRKKSINGIGTSHTHFWFRENQQQIVPVGEYVSVIDVP